MKRDAVAIALGLVAVAGLACAPGETSGGSGGRSGGGGGNAGVVGTGGNATASGGAPGSGGAGAGATGGSAAGGASGTGAGGGGAPGNGTGGASGVGGGAGRGTGGAGAGGAGTGTGGRGTGGAAATGGASGTGGGSGIASKLVGFATLNGGTTGGGAGQTVTATTYDQLKMYAESATAYVIKVQGTIQNGANGGQIRVKSNKSIVGVGNNAFLFGVGIDITNSNNIIIQNLRVSMTGVTTRTDTAGVYTSQDDEGVPAILVNGGDAISISGTSKNICIDHCELFSEDPAKQTNHDLYDGLIDIKGQTGFITISWNYFHDHHKVGLVGAADDDFFADRKVTYHHNYYNNAKLRIPMYRGAVGHFFNNYIVGAQDASEIRAGTCVKIEKNYYEALHYSIYTPSDSPGQTERVDNIEVMRTSRAYPDACTATLGYPYTDALTATTADVKTVVPAGAGVGKI